MTRDLDVLLATCAAAPDDDAPRLVYADAIGGERGELIVVQCDLARHARTPYLAMAEVVARRKRERELLATLPVPATAVCVQYTRGLITAAEIQYRASAEAVAQISPVLDALTLNARDLAILDGLPQIRALDLYNSDDTALGEVPFDRLVAFGLHGSVDLTDDLFLPPIPQLRALWLRAGVELTRLDDYPELVSLDLSGANLHRDSVEPALDRPLIDLVISANSTHVLGRCGARHTLEDLVILPGNWSPSLTGLAQLESLMRLTLVFDRARPPPPLDPLRDLAPSLRELRFTNLVDPTVLADLVSVLGPRLQRLSLAQVLDRPQREAIEPLVAGELCDGDLDVPRALLGTSRTTLLGDRRQPGYRSDNAYVLRDNGDLRQMFGGEIFIGRGDHGELVVGGNVVPYRRTSIRRDVDLFSIEDHGEAGWTFVNSKPITRAELRDGDAIGVAGEMFRFYCGLGALDRARASKR